MIRHAGHDIEVRDVAAGDHDMIIGQLAVLTVVAFIFEQVALQIDVSDLLRATLDFRQQLPQGNDHIIQAQGRSDGIGQQGAEDQVILLVEEHYFGFIPAQARPQGLGTFYAAKTSADDDDAFPGQSDAKTGVPAAIGNAGLSGI